MVPIKDMKRAGTLIRLTTRFAFDESTVNLISVPVGSLSLMDGTFPFRTSLSLDGTLTYKNHPHPSTVISFFISSLSK